MLAAPGAQLGGVFVEERKQVRSEKKKLQNKSKKFVFVGQNKAFEFSIGR